MPLNSTGPPDSKSLAYVAAEPPGENNWWTAKLYKQTIGGEAKVILSPTEVQGALHNMQIARPALVAGRQANCLHRRLMSDQGSTGGDVWIVSETGTDLHDLTAGPHLHPRVDRLG